MIWVCPYDLRNLSHIFQVSRLLNIWLIYMQIYQVFGVNDLHILLKASKLTNHYTDYSNVLVGAPTSVCISEYSHILSANLHIAMENGPKIVIYS